MGLHRLHIPEVVLSGWSAVLYQGGYTMTPDRFQEGDCLYSATSTPAMEVNCFLVTDT